MSEVMVNPATIMGNDFVGKCGMQENVPEEKTMTFAAWNGVPYSSPSA